MGQKEKLLAKLFSNPHDFSFHELERLLGYLGFERSNKGRTSGSRVRFSNKEDVNMSINMHRPHPDGMLKPYQIRQLVNYLEERGLI